MRFRHTQRSREQVTSAPRQVQKALDKQLRFLVEDLRHPSLRAKKYDEVTDIWQARVTQGWRVYFQIQGDTYVILAVIPHPK
jgi:mRNA interferase RelE/StbE